MTLTVFVSSHHSPEEDAFTALIVADLAAAGAEVFIDHAFMETGDLVRHFKRESTAQKWFVLVVTPAAMADSRVNIQTIAAALEWRAERLQGVVPLVLQPSPDEQFNVLIRSLHLYDGIVCDATTSYEVGRDQLLDALTTPPQELPRAAPSIPTYRVAQEEAPPGDITIDPETVRLARGRHRSPEQGVSVMELVPYLAHEPFSDHPTTTSEVITIFLRYWNDALDDDDRQMRGVLQARCWTRCMRRWVEGGVESCQVYGPCCLYRSSRGCRSRDAGSYRGAASTISAETTCYPQIPMATGPLNYILAPIRVWRTHMTQRSVQLRIFISYRSADRVACNQLAAALRGAGADVWYDEHGAVAGQAREGSKRTPRPGQPVEEVLIQGKALVAQKMFGVSLPFFERATQIAPRSFDAWLAMGYALNQFRTLGRSAACPGARYCHPARRCCLAQQGPGVDWHETQYGRVGGVGAQDFTGARKHRLVQLGCLHIGPAPPRGGIAR